MLRLQSIMRAEVPAATIESILRRVHCVLRVLDQRDMLAGRAGRCYCATLRLSSEPGIQQPAAPRPCSL